MRRIICNTLYIPLLLLVCTSFQIFSPTDLRGERLNEKSAYLWPYEKSELNYDPSLLIGQLKNGLRYIIKENQEPENRVALFLIVHAGSGVEEDEEQGVAHFLEHMIFNGTTNFPPGTIVEYFQDIGMDFGGDINAYTGFNSTVYHLVLPQGTDQELIKGLTVLSDFARGALLLEDEIDKERGVIFSEKRDRNSARYRNQLAYSQFAYSGTIYPMRNPIGTDHVVKTADRKLLTHFYDSWYRPENMTLVVVGDLSPVNTQELLRGELAGLRAFGEMPPRPPFGSLAHSELSAFYNYEPELGGTTVGIETVWNVNPGSQSLQKEKEDVAQLIGELILGYRLSALNESETVPFVWAGYSSGKIAGKIGYHSLRAVVDGGSWRESLRQLHIVLERAEKYGFTVSEFERAREEIQTHLRKAVETAGALSSREIAQRLTESLIDGEVYMSPGQELSLYSEILNELGLSDVNNEFRLKWSSPARLISVTGNTEIPGKAKEKINNYYKSLQEEPVNGVEEDEVIAFPYLEPPEGRAQVIEEREFKGVGVKKYTFKNGLIVNLKKTDFEPNKLQLTVNFGSGQLTEPVSGISLITDDVVNLSGTNTLRSSQLDSLLAGSSVELSFRIGRASSSWSGSCLSSDWPAMVQLLHTLLVDYGVRASAYSKTMQSMELMHKRLDSTLDGAFLYKVKPFLAGGNSQYGLVPWKQLRNVSYNDVNNWASTLMSVKDLEVSVVGDFEAEKVLADLGLYLGGFELSMMPVRKSDMNLVFPLGESLGVVVESTVEKSRVYLFFPTDDMWDISKTRRLSILSAILEDRLRKLIREELGASYSPRVANYGSREHVGFGYLQLELDVEKGSEVVLLGRLVEVINKLLKEGVQQEEVERAKRPFMTSIRDNMETNEYWLYSVLALSSTFPQQLEWPTTILEDFSSISTEEINHLAKRYLRVEMSASATLSSVSRKAVKGRMNN